MLKEAKNIAKAVQPAAEVAAAGLVIGIIGGVGVTIRNHRELTHRSLTLHPTLSKLFDLNLRTVSYGDSNVWAAVHRVHHNVPDGTLKPFMDISRAANWMEQNMDKVPNVYVPEFYSGLDPFVKKFTHEEVMKIGNMAEDFMKERLGDRYLPPEDYTEQQLRKMLLSGEPAYFYPKEKHQKGSQYTQDEIEHILLGDPHSPVRIAPPELNGVKGVFEGNISLYHAASSMFTEMPELMPEDLKPANGDKLRQSSKAEIAAGFLVPSGAVLLRRGKYDLKDFGIALGSGVAINTIRTALMILGGNAVNSLGHAGKLTDRVLMEAIQSGEYKPKVNPDGSVTTNTNEAGFLVHLAHRISLDEVLGQAEHHGFPEKIAYTEKTGWRAWNEAPWGKFLEVLADAKWFPLINPGPGFNLKPGETRPDVPHPAMQIVHDIRARDYAKKNTA